MTRLRATLCGHCCGGGRALQGRIGRDAGADGQTVCNLRTLAGTIAALPGDQHVMTRRERLMATLQGRPVDRPAVSFYEIGGFAVDGDNPDEFNVYNDPSWRPLLQLAEEKTDLIRMCGPGRGFVLMPSASPYGPRITPQAMANYQTMVRLATNFAGP